MYNTNTVQKEASLWWVQSYNKSHHKHINIYNHKPLFYKVNVFIDMFEHTHYQKIAN